MIARKQERFLAALVLCMIAFVIAIATANHKLYTQPKPSAAQPAIDAMERDANGDPVDTGYGYGDSYGDSEHHLGERPVHLTAPISDLDNTHVEAFIYRPKHKRKPKAGDECLMGVWPPAPFSCTYRNGINVLVDDAKEFREYQTTGGPQDDFATFNVLPAPPYEHSYMQIVGDKELDFRQWDKAGSHYTIDASPDAFDCPAEFDETPDHHSRLTIRCTPKASLFTSKALCDDLPDTVKLTCLMEQVAPTPKLYQHESTPALWHCRENGDCTPTEPPTFGIPQGETVKPCKLPSDIDVCPIQMLEPKANHD